MKKHRIETRAGCYTGTVEASGVISFKGIPFAKAPVGKLRWLPPQPLDFYDEERQADLFPPAPIQLDYPKHLANQMKEPIHIPVSEDCLYLNVWAADLETPKKGILFWVFGGSYAIGHASRVQSRGEAFVAAHPEIVVVAANYRLGVFGSLDLAVIGGGPEYQASNNLNLLDQRAALEWVRENAEQFAADPETITLYGHSAGSNAICHHLASPNSVGLFRRAICQSSFLQGPPPRTLEEAQEASRKVFAAAGVETVSEALTVSSEVLLAAQKEVFGEIYGSPVMDGVVVQPDEFGAYLSGVAAGKDIVIGYSNGERDSGFVGLSAEEAIERVKRTNSRLLAGREDVVEQFLGLHTEMPVEMACMTLQEELAMTVPAEIQARALAASSRVYQYQFSWADTSTGIRAPHGAPCPFVFGNQVPSCAPSDLVAQMQDAFAAFIAMGDPNCASIPYWPQYSTNGGTVMEMDAEWNARDGFWARDYPLLAPLFKDAERLQEK